MSSGSSVCSPSFPASVPTACVSKVITDIRGGTLTIATLMSAVWAIGCVLASMGSLSITALANIAQSNDCEPGLLGEDEDMPGTYAAHADELEKHLTDLSGNYDPTEKDDPSDPDGHPAVATGAATFNPATLFSILKLLFSVGSMFLANPPTK